MSALQYLYYFLWRVCRAARDPNFGEFRVLALLIVVESMFVFGVMYAVMWRSNVEVSFLVFVLVAVGAPSVMNFYLFTDARKRKPYERRFLRLSRAERWAADSLAAAFCIGALALPFAVRAFLVQG